MNNEKETYGQEPMWADERAMEWAWSRGILPEGDPNTLVTRRELAGVMHHALEYFWRQIISAVETQKE